MLITDCLGYLRHPTILLLTLTMLATVANKFLFRCPIFGARSKNGSSKRNCTSNQDTTRNIDFCFLLPEYNLQPLFLMSKSFRNEAFVVGLMVCA